MSEQSANQGLRVLVVDDDDDTREVIKDLLEGEGFSVSEAGNGKLALDFLRSTEPALVVLDLEMPVMSGTELLATMKTDERLCSIPVLILSGTDKSKSPSGQSVVGFVSKPCNMSEFARAVSTHVKRSDGALAAAPRPRG